MLRWAIKIFLQWAVRFLQSHLLFRLLSSESDTSSAGWSRMNRVESATRSRWLRQQSRASWWGCPEEDACFWRRASARFSFSCFTSRASPNQVRLHSYSTPVQRILRQPENNVIELKRATASDVLEVKMMKEELGSIRTNSLYTYVHNVSLFRLFFCYECWELQYKVTHWIHAYNRICCYGNITVYGC